MMNADEMLKYTKSKEDVFLETLTHQAGTDALEAACRIFPKMRELSPEDQKQEVGRVMDIMAENRMATTVENAIRAGKFLESSEMVDAADWMERTGYQPPPRDFPKFDDETAEGKQRQEEYLRSIPLEDTAGFLKAKYDGVSQPQPIQEQRPATKTPDVLYYDGNGFPVFSEVR